MRLFRDCMGCCLTWMLLLLILLGLSIYFGLPIVMDAIEQLARGV